MIFEPDSGRQGETGQRKTAKPFVRQIVIGLLAIPAREVGFRELCIFRCGDRKFAQRIVSAGERGTGRFGSVDVPTPAIGGC